MSAAPDVTIAGDWGTTRLRLYLREGGAIERRVEGPGIGAVGSGALAVLEAALAELAPPPALPVRLCGMAGARGALFEAPYVPCPADADAWAAATARTEVAGRPVLIAAGLRYGGFPGGPMRGALPPPPDVMRGEETQIFGALRLQPALAEGRHVVVHPGTHTKWAVIDGGVVRSFHTYPVGELFALLTQHSTLLRAGAPEGDAEDGFALGLTAADGPGPLGGLFAARTAQLLEGRSASWARAYLSGLLIGAEVASALPRLGSPARVTLIGDPKLAESYAHALSLRGAEADRLDGEACVLAGLALLG